MSTLFVSSKQTVMSIKTQGTDNICEGPGKIENSYEYKGYQIRVHFNGNKTLKHCIQNLAERKFEC